MTAMNVKTIGESGKLRGERIEAFGGNQAAIGENADGADNFLEGAVEIVHFDTGAAIGIGIGPDQVTAGHDVGGSLP